MNESNIYDSPETISMTRTSDELIRYKTGTHLNLASA